MAIDARTLTTPIICSVSDIAPHVETSKPTDRSKSIEGLKQVVEYNNSAHDRAVSILVRATGNQHAIRVNETKNRR